MDSLITYRNTKIPSLCSSLPFRFPLDSQLDEQLELDLILMGRWIGQARVLTYKDEALAVAPH
jgi:hypothetical protein